MNTIELIEDVCVFGGNLPNERLAEVRAFINKTKAQQLLQTDVSISLTDTYKLANNYTEEQFIQMMNHLK